ncbi:hypothetical protein [Streptomyces sp. AP-93]|uniref:hypothetical protein n=1 Tax=Streptomyces sp. AP-93 TaxID=2929048 RepID=UPI001FAFD637|nr:hypothetical protein [Streptomyces sp. AP-93]MCJ0868580.1 hypothetical protein [Streptomyces sp. AP-93]
MLAESLLAGRSRPGGPGPSDWYLPPSYGAAETGSAIAPHRASRTATPALLASQRADGGWPRIPDEPYSSPTATGLALTALTASGLGPQDTAVAHGLR